MAVRHRKRGRHKYHRTRSWGAGNTKNRRGKGCRGGSGNAGPQKARWTYFTTYEPDHLGRHGFVRPNAKKRMPTADLNDIQRMVDKGDLKKSGNKLEYAFEGKVLGSGKLTSPVLVTAKSFSEKAKEKIGKAGGEAKTE
ncbi:MAG: uL15m family ribosomal protein [Candidatus Micrarchaeota archaeon]